MANFVFDPNNCNIDGCVETALNALPKSALTSINAGIVTTLQILQDSRAILSLRLLNMDILMAPLLLEQDAINALINEVRSNVRLIPVDLAADCPDLGQLNIYVEQTLDQELAKLKTLLFRINRMISAKGQLTLQLSQIDTLLQFLTCFQQVLTTVQSGISS